MDSDLSDRVANVCYEMYSSLGKSGKPRDDTEWTLLAGFVLQLGDDLRLASLATGTKCVGANAMCPLGLLVNDSHAEVLARRGFLRYLYEELKKVLIENCDSYIFAKGGTKSALKSGIRVHMFTSQVPCGDASIIPMKESPDTEQPPVKRQRVDVHRTGAKPLSWEFRQDPRTAGADYHTRGAVRIKPGRGDPTLSLSCSDKIAKWIQVGVQGALVSHLIEKPIRLSSVVVGGGGPFNYDVVYGAFVARARTPSQHIPHIVQSRLIFCHSQVNCINGKPSPASIVWANVEHKPLEISVEGKRLGTTTKSKDKGRLKISKRELLNSFLSLVDGKYENKSYRQLKDGAEEYQNLCNLFKSNIGAWSVKPPYENFIAS